MEIAEIIQIGKPQVAIAPMLVMGAIAAAKGIYDIASKKSSATLNKEQRDQQRDLTDIQIEGSKELTDYNKAKDLQMWKDTNYSEQVAQAKKAGLNPALLYGQGGGGGVTTGGSGGNVTGGQAADTAGRQNADTNSMEAITQMALQLGQANLINAQTENTKAGTTKITDADIPKAKAETENTEEDTINKGLKNINQQTANEIQKATKETQIDQAIADLGQTRENVNKTVTETNRNNLENNITDKTTNTQIQQRRANLQNTIADTLLKKSGTELNAEQARVIATKIEQGWEQLRNTGKQIDMSKENTERMARAIIISAGINATGKIIDSVVGILSKTKAATSTRSGGQNSNGDWWESFSQTTH